MESILGDISGRAMRRYRYDPWLVETLTTLQNPMTTTELQELVAEWRPPQTALLLPQPGDG